MLSRRAKEDEETADNGSEAGEPAAWGPYGPTKERGGAQRGQPDDGDGGESRAGSGRPSDVAMVQATDFANRDAPAAFGPLN